MEDTIFAIPPGEGWDLTNPQSYLMYLSYLSGLEFAKRELLRMYENVGISEHLAAGIVEHLGETELDKKS